MIYYVYSMEFNNEVRYIGITNNIKRRQTEHRRLSKKDDIKKYLYKMIKEYNKDDEIVLKPIYEGNKLEAMRMEAYLILDDYFKDKKLWQSPPFSFKYF